MIPYRDHKDPTMMTKQIRYSRCNLTKLSAPKTITMSRGMDHQNNHEKSTVAQAYSAPKAKSYLSLKIVTKP